jgi:fatty acid desaturase
MMKAALIWNFDRLVDPSLSSKMCFVLAAGTMLGWTAGINLGVVCHNQPHRGVFRSARLDRWIGRLWTISSGWPRYFSQYKHLAVHPKHVGQMRDLSAEPCR